MTPDFLTLSIRKRWAIPRVDSAPGNVQRMFSTNVAIRLITEGMRRKLSSVTEG